MNPGLFPLFEDLHFEIVELLRDRNLRRRAVVHQLFVDLVAGVVGPLVGVCGTTTLGIGHVNALNTA